MNTNRLLNLVGAILATIVMIFMISNIVSFVNVSKDVFVERQQTQLLANESFYSPMMINDSTAHINISDVSCMMLQVVNDTLEISYHNVTFVNYAMYTHELYIMTSDSKGQPVTLEMNLDTVIPYVPNFARIKD